MISELSIVIVNWNGGDLLRRCVQSVLQSPPSLSYDFIVVDNASSDASIDWLRSSEAAAQLGDVPLRLIENTENLGFSKANNQAIACGGGKLLFLLNPDTKVLPGAIDTLITTLQSSQRAGACGPRLLNTDGSLQYTVFPNPPTPWEILVSGLRLYRLLPKRLRADLLLGGHWQHDTRRDVHRLSGAAILVKREVVEDVGGLDENYHMYGEDAEWCLRMVRAGWQLIFEPAAEVVHHGSQSSMIRWDSLEVGRRILDGNLRFQKQCLSRPHLIANIVAGLIVALASHSWRGLRGAQTTETGMALRLYADYLKNSFR